MADDSCSHYDYVSSTLLIIYCLIHLASVDAIYVTVCFIVFSIKPDHLCFLTAGYIVWLASCIA